MRPPHSENFAAFGVHRVARTVRSWASQNRINISDHTHAQVKDFFECEYRVLTKEKKEVEMYFVNGVLPSLLDDATEIPPPGFLRRYGVYFQKEPPAFPAFLLEPAPDTQPAAANLKSGLA